MTFNIGDLVYVRPHTYVEKNGYGRHGIDWTLQMELLDGRVATIQHIEFDRYLVEYHNIGAWFVEGSLRQCNPKFKNGENVLIQKPSEEEKEFYSNYYKQAPNGFEPEIGMVESFQIEHGRNVYEVIIHGKSWTFFEESLINVGYDLF